MKRFLIAPLACALAVSTFADEVKPSASSDSKKTDEIKLDVAAAKVTAPLVLTNGYLVLPDTRAELGEGGKAVIEFTIATEGDYVIHASVNAPGEDSNSFFVNIDEKLEDPLTIWDIDTTTGFEDRVVSWRGDGAADSDQFSPKKFKLTAGKHQLVISGREPETQLKSLSIRAAK